MGVEFPGFRGSAVVRTDTLSRFDLFMAVWARQECTVSELCQELLLPSVSWLDLPLEEAVASGLLLYRGGVLRRSSDPRAATLFRSLNFALAYGIDYDTYQDPDVEALLQAAYGKPAFWGDQVPSRAVQPRVLRRLVQDGLLVVYSYAPLVGRLIPNPFLDELAAYQQLKPPRPVVEVPQAAATLRSRRLGEFQTPVEACDALGVGDPDEGSLSVTQRLIRHDMVHREEGLLDASARKRYEEALVMMRDKVLEGRRLSGDLILAYHAALMGGEPGAGQVRKTRVSIPNNPKFKVAPADRIPSLLLAMLDRYSRLEPRGLGEQLEQAAWLANELLHIHPFVDGNSRTARIVLSHFLREHRSPLEEIPAPFELLFLLATKGGHQRSDLPLAGLLADILVQALNRRDLGAVGAGRS